MTPLSLLVGTIVRHLKLSLTGEIIIIIGVIAGGLFLLALILGLGLVFFILRWNKKKRVTNFDSRGERSSTSRSTATASRETCLCLFMLLVSIFLMSSKRR